MGWAFWRIRPSTKKQLTTINGRLDRHSQDLKAVRDEVAALVKSQQKDTVVKEEPSHLPKDLKDYSKHIKLLRIAADIATAQLNCHRDTWAYLAEKAAPQPQHFRTPGDVTDWNGRIRTTISGRSLIAILTALWSIAHKPHPTNAELVDWALAVTLYKQIAKTIERLRHGAQGQTPVVITIDRHPPLTGKTPESGSTSDTAP